MYAFRRYLAEAPEGALAIDCGANVGDITAAMVRDGLRVIAFEPDPICIAQLRHRFADESRVTVIPKAVGASERRAALYRQMADGVPYTEGSSLQRAGHHAPEPATEVEVVDLVEFLHDLDEPVYVLKLDIEGAEAEVLEAMFDHGAPSQIGRIFVETHEPHSDQLAARLQAIRRTAALKYPNIDLDWG